MQERGKEGKRRQTEQRKKKGTEHGKKREETTMVYSTNQGGKGQKD